MRLTESKLRSIIRNVIRESIEGGSRLKPGFDIDVESFAYIIKDIAQYAHMGFDDKMYHSDEDQKSDIVEMSGREGLKISVADLDRLYSELGGQSDLYNDEITSEIKISNLVFESLGFTQSDYDVIFSHKFDEDEDPDYQRSFVEKDATHIVFYIRN